MRTIIFIFLFFNFFNSNAQVIAHFKYNGKDAEIIILPFDYILPDSLTYIGKLKSGDPYLAESPTYKPNYKNQLNIICADAMKAEANVIQMTSFLNVKWKDQYKLKAKGYKVRDVERFKKDVLTKKESERKQMENYATVIIYRPNYTESLNDLKNYKLVINNDTVAPVRNSKFRIRVSKEGKTEIKIMGTNMSLTVDVKFGTNYYVCTYADSPNYSGVQINGIAVPLNGYVSRMELVDAEKGEIESSFIKSNP